MPASEYVVHTLADLEFVRGQFVLHASPIAKAAQRSIRFGPVPD
jgi:hypothetical protein